MIYTLSSYSVLGLVSEYSLYSECVVTAYPHSHGSMKLLHMKRKFLECFRVYTLKWTEFFVRLRASFFAYLCVFVGCCLWLSALL